jgi:hypothetical protein
MTCVMPPALTELEIDMLLADEAPPAVVEHHRRCPACAQRVARLAAEEASLRAHLFRADCPESLALGEWHLGLVSQQEARQIEAHLNVCPWCKQEIEELVAMLAAPPVKMDASFVGLRRLIASLATSLSGEPSAVVAVRGGSKEPLAFQADDVSLTLSTEPGPNGRLTLIGFLTSSEGGLGALAGQTIQLLQYDEPVAETVVDELHNFAFDQLTPGFYTLAIPRDTEVILIPELELTLS